MRSKNLLKRLQYLLCGCLLFSGIAVAQAPRADVHIFWSKGCPHCEKALAYLVPLPDVYSGLKIHPHEVSSDKENLAMLVEFAKQRQLHELGVPLTVIGDEIMVGYQDDATTGEWLKSRIESCLQKNCVTHLAGPRPQLAASAPVTIPTSIDLPLFGQTNLRSLSLPVLTIALAAADGFNPCAMWVLVFLMGLLLGVTSRFRRWLLGGSFIASSAFVYFLIMAAWLNTLQFLGAVIWLRMAIAILALLVGFWSIRAGMKKEITCSVTAAPARRAVFDKLRQLALSSSLPLAITGICLLAFAVNIVELLCSAGIPAVYTQYLALQALPPWQHYLYLGLYILVFMADDLLVFIGAMLTLEIAGLGQHYSRWSKLIGGVIMLILGMLMLFRPEWLS